MTNKDKLKKISSTLNDDEAGLLFSILLKSLESANHQTVKYDAEELKDQNQETLMINIEMKIKHAINKVREYLDILK
jgi:hypothetical protein